MTLMFKRDARYEDLEVHKANLDLTPGIELEVKIFQETDGRWSWNLYVGDRSRYSGSAGSLEHAKEWSAAVTAGYLLWLARTITALDPGSVYAANGGEPATNRRILTPEEAE